MKTIPPAFSLNDHTITNNPFIMEKVKDYEKELRDYQMDTASLADKYQFIQTMEELDDYSI